MWASINTEMTVGAHFPEDCESQIVEVSQFGDLSTRHLLMLGPSFLPFLVNRNNSHMLNSRLDEC